MNKVVVLLLIPLLFMVSCAKEKPAAVGPPKFVGVEPIEPVMLEQGTENIPYWLSSGQNKRVLIHVSPIDGLAPVDGENLGTLKNLASARDYEGLKKKGDVTMQGFIYTSDNIVSLAKGLGVVDEVYWVLPIFGSLDEKGFEDMKDFFGKKYPGQVKGLSSFKLNGNVAYGEINGVKVHFMGLMDLPELKARPAMLYVDASFFTNLYANEKDTKALGMVAGFFSTLNERKVSTDLVTISRSNANGLAPLHFRYMAGYLADLFRDPSLISRKEPPRLWSERADAWKTAERSMDEAIPIYRNILKEFPDDAASRFDLSFALLETGDYEGCKAELATAVRLDPGYRPAYGVFAERLQQGGKADKAKEFAALM